MQIEPVESPVIQEDPSKKQAEEPTEYNNFIDRLFEFYPSYIKEDYRNHNIILLNGINYENLSQTEIAYFLSKQPLKETRVIETKTDLKNGRQPRQVNPSLEHIPFNETSQFELESRQNLAECEKKSKQEEIKFCICNNTINPVEKMQINCDNCQRWYHPLCMKISKIEIDIINSHDKNKWYCKDCLK